ncbi:MAG: response regulator SirA [Mesorhizobium sp.]|uniref:Response regulator SirA n=3 Tax=Mesorhizobium TaxID=68287 RepID=A0AB36R7X2_9HYPH|nr:MULTISPECIES: sulfurtransferase TusA family protein [Mesorhizobium]PAQ00768.1 response regulator SirA [Mesorhizobium mediterraneum]RUU32428.1 response regulator SirA [Mesorhizobium sp. M6A.T.Ce.TU.016.01.1.1]RUU95393.1 response regulator SirA [Mesorhizobium sp. M6A.T.Cr.TU.017.01.1.1]RVB75866.1 response regulator SirA [Mesorhizobium sp. M6A.T.Cr.TU.014.01.1.1]RWN27987.1 MAG: response regulator SirA [Mesorhizobium sp.]
MAKPTSVYDLKGLNCPLPVLKAKKRLAAMRPGSRLWLETTDPLAVIDIPAFCTDAGHRLVETAAVSGAHRFLVERGEQSLDHDPEKWNPVFGKDRG